MLTAVGLLVAGIVILVLGGEGTVRGGTALAARFHVPPYVVGATVVAFGTSAPELAVTLTAAIEGSPGLALGNVVGSNIANLGLILGLASIITPIAMGAQRVKREVPVMIGVLVLLVVFALDKRIEAWEGAVLLAAMVSVMVLTIRSRHDDDAVPDTSHHPTLLVAVPILIGGLIGLYLGGDLLVRGAVQIAEARGVPEWVIGAVIVAVGTSMPEVAASVVAAAKGRGDIALGNVIGSNTFNVLLVLGTGSVIKPIRVQVDITTDLIVVSALTLLPGLALLFARRVPRWTGATLLAGYVVYLILKVTVR